MLTIHELIFLYNLYINFTGKVCGPFEEATQCDVPCQPTCQDPNRPPCPTLVCGSPDCVCKKGYIRKTDGSGCIPRGNCPGMLTFSSEKQ